MKVLMFGWEFAPSSSGGLGTACYGLTEGLIGEGVEIVFVMPGTSVDTNREGLRTIGGNILSGSRRKEDHKTASMRIKPVGVLLSPYMTDSSYRTTDGKMRENGKYSGTTVDQYGQNIYQEVLRYAEVAREIAKDEDFDVVHVHDWMAIPAGIAARDVKGTPLIVHIHSLESDRTALRVDEWIYGIERFGMTTADHIVAVSGYTKKKIVDQYDVSPEKISVVYNAVFPIEFKKEFYKDGDQKQVLFLGRLTAQKGPGYFLDAARKVVAVDPDVRFIIAGDGELTEQLKEETAFFEMEDHVQFTGFLKGTEVEQMYAISDLYVMPSLSEPFGITALEAAKYEVPVILSTQSGVAEVLKRAPSVEFWDTDELAQKILEILHDHNVHDRIVEDCREDMKGLSWKEAAKKITSVYRRILK